MLKNKILLFFLAFVVVFTSCKDENLAPIATFDGATKGAYPRLLDQGNNLFNLLDINGVNYCYTVEFVDNEKGGQVSEYQLLVEYDDNDSSNGDKSAGPNVFRTFSAGDFSASPNGFQSPGEICINSSDVLSAFGLSADDVSPGDNFNFIGSVTLNDGSSYGQANSSSTVTGAAFRGHFNFTMPAACPSDLTGSYSRTSADAWCGGSVDDGSVEIIALGAGVYHFSDWSFGAYGPCYGGTADQPGLTFTEVCQEVSFTGFTDSFGDTWTYDSDIDGAVWRIKWENTYSESGEVFITHPSGSWPFTLK